MEIFISFGLIGSFAPWRAGGSTGNHFPHHSFCPARRCPASAYTPVRTMAFTLPGIPIVGQSKLRNGSYEMWVSELAPRCLLRSTVYCAG